MSSAENQQHTFPAAPPSLSAGDHEMRDYYAGQDASRPTINQAPYLTPYLGLRARLSQIWINRWTILLLLVLVRVLLAIKNMDSDINSARTKALSSCTSIEAVGSNMASMPFYMSRGVNEMVATGIEKAVNGLMSMLTLTMTGVEEIVVFYINMLTSTYVCLITFAVTGSIKAAVDLIDDVTKFLNTTVGAIGDDLSSIATSFEDSLNSFIKALNSVPFTKAAIPTLDISGDISKLHDLQLPSNLTAPLDNLKNNLPTFQDVNNFTSNLIRLPFEKVKGLVNESLGTYEFNRSLLPVPQKEQLTFCSDNNGINDFFDGLTDLANLARKIFIGVILVLAVLVCIPMAYSEIRRWRTMQQRAQLVNTNAFNPMDVVYIASRPYTSTFGIKLANRFSSTRRQTAVRWAVAYATSVPALFVLSLGIAGLFACLCQFILLRSIQKEVPSLTNEVTNFTDRVVTSLNNASQQWAIGTNKAINDTSNTINHDVFGWVNISTTAVNNTLNGFVDEMTTVLNKTFGGTPLYDPITDVLNCLVTLKIQGIQKGLTWVHDHAYFTFPTLPNNTFTLEALASTGDKSNSSLDSFLADPGSSASNEIAGAIDNLTRLIAAGIRQEAIIATMIVLVWVIIALIGTVRACTVAMGRGKTRAEGGQAYAIDPETDNNRGHDNFRPESMAPPYEYHVNKAAPYTINPRPFPTFEPVPTHTAGPSDEKMGEVGAQNVGAAVIQPHHLRASSYGQVGGPSPINEKSAGDPFADHAR